MNDIPLRTGMFCGFAYRHCPHSFCYSTSGSLAPHSWPVAYCDGYDWPPDDSRCPTCGQAIAEPT